MFTGIITDIGSVIAVAKSGDTRFEIATAYDTATIDIGASIACSGVCLTVIEKSQTSFAVEASQETLSLTTASAWAQGTKLNLERALAMGDELGGHIVSGHVDGVASIASISQEGDSRRFTFTAPNELMGFIAVKGSVVLDGVSLTVNEIAQNVFGVNIIPHTLSATNFGDAKEGDKINLEIDTLARYVARLQEWKETQNV